MTGSIIPEEHVVIVGKGRIHHRQVPVVLIVSNRDTHIGDFPSVPIQSIAVHVTVVFECSIALVDVEIVWRGVIGYQQVRLAVVVDVCEQGTQPVIAIGIVDAKLLAHVGKGAVAIVVKQMVMLANQPTRAAHHRHTTKLADQRARLPS